MTYRLILILFLVVCSWKTGFLDDEFFLFNANLRHQKKIKERFDLNEGSGLFSLEN